MNEDRITRRFCAIFQLNKASDLQRVANAVPAFVKMIERWSKGEMEQLCRSNDGQLFGFLFKSTKPVIMLRSEFEGSNASHGLDTFIVFEVGDEHCGSGFSRADTWLQHH